MQPVSSVPVTTRGMMWPIHMKQGFMHKHAGCRKRRARAAGEPGYKEDVRMCACPHASLPGPL